MFEKGQGVKQDYAKALLRYLNAAVMGHASAQDNLGCMYLHGRGVKQNYSKALSWFRSAAEKRKDSAQNNLGCMYQNGLGVKQDYREKKWRKNRTPTFLSRDIYGCPVFFYGCPVFSSCFFFLDNLNPLQCNDLSLESS